jgi:hypothetical protein
MSIEMLTHAETRRAKESEERRLTTKKAKITKKRRTERDGRVGMKRIH